MEEKIVCARVRVRVRACLIKVGTLMFSTFFFKKKLTYSYCPKSLLDMNISPLKKLPPVAITFPLKFYLL